MSQKDAKPDLGTRIQKLGCGLTLVLTIPILGVVFFGVLGLIVGIVIALLFGVGMVGSAFTKQPEEHRCPACHTVVPEGQEFCGKCGSRFS